MNAVRTSQVRQGTEIRAESGIDGQPKLDSPESDFSSALYPIPPHIFSFIPHPFSILLNCLVVSYQL